MNDISKQSYRLPTPVADLAELTDWFGQAWAAPSAEPIVQYLAWIEAAGMFSFLYRRGPATIEEITSNCPLNEAAVEALTTLLASLKLVRREDGKVRLMPLGAEYLVANNPFYVGDGLYLKCGTTIPSAFLKSTEPKHAGAMRLPVAQRLKVQHSRNFAPSVVAARSGRFDEVRRLLDIAGGSGVLAIPLALDHAQMRITLVELPEAINDCREILKAYGVDSRIELIGTDVIHDEWRFGQFDGIFFGNFFHSNDDSTCCALVRKSFETLSANGRIWLHEVVFNETRDGPLLAALWNVLMLNIKPGARQRTTSELFRLLTEGGFQSCRSIATAGGFTLLEGRKS